MQTIYIGNTLINDIFLGNQRMDDTLQQTTFYSVGNAAFGGIIIYVTGSLGNQSGIVAALEDLPQDNGGSVYGTYPWGCSGTSISTSTAVGTGQSNTNNILSTCATRPIIASKVDSWTNNGYSDWYLPSEGELDLMNAIYASIPSLSGRYASSTQTNTTQYRARWIDPGGFWTNFGKDLTNATIKMRACRTFGTL